MSSLLRDVLSGWFWSEMFHFKINLLHTFQSYSKLACEALKEKHATKREDWRHRAVFFVWFIIIINDTIIFYKVETNTKDKQLISVYQKGK